MVSETNITEPEGEGQSLHNFIQKKNEEGKRKKTSRKVEKLLTVTIDCVKDWWPKCDLLPK